MLFKLFVFHIKDIHKEYDKWNLFELFEIIVLNLNFLKPDGEITGKDRLCFPDFRRLFYKKRGKGEGSEGGFLTFVFFFRENIDRKK